MKKVDRAAKKAREDQALNRVLWWFGGAVVLEFFLLLLNRFYINYDVQGTALAGGIFRFLQVFTWVCLAAAVALGVLWLLRRKKGKSLPALGGGCLAATVLFLCSFVAAMWGRDGGVRFLYVCVPVAAVLALVYYLYQREFFLVALQGGAAIFALWYFANYLKRGSTAAYAVAIALLVLTAVAAAVLVLFQRGKGMLGKVRVLPRKTNYIFLYLAAGITGLSLAAAMIFGAAVAYGAMLAVVAWLFGAAIYYTVRLM